MFTAVLTAGVALTFGLMSKTPAKAQSEDYGEGQSRVERGFDAAPVKLNLHHKNRALVGLGSYIVNVQADCNGCHSAGPSTQFTSNPYLRSPNFTPPKKVNLATYLGGGRDFGPLIAKPEYPHIISRNLTPGQDRAPGRRAVVF